MQRFWDTVVGPVLGAVRPKIIVEIGSDQGGNTVNLLEFCERTGATLHVIDPAPKYDASKWQGEHDAHLVIHEDLSLNALPSIGDFDVVLIDGDHNWYTVFNELQTIERLCEERGREFPLVLLHDIGWPYGRRDLYYDPDSIPEEHRKPHEKKGMLPGTPDLVERGGLNRHLNNALRENGPENGVLTAVEDFLGASRLELELLQLPGIHGLGILTPLPLKQKYPDLERLLGEMDFSPFFVRYVDGVESARLELQIDQQTEHGEWVRGDLPEGEAQEYYRQRLAEESWRLKEARHELSLARRDVLQLSEWLYDLDDGISVLLKSRRWRVSSAVIGLYRKARFKGPETAVDGAMEDILRKFRSWHKERIVRNQESNGNV
jgi:Methyltransferase domain